MLYKEALISPIKKNVFFVIQIYHFVPRHGVAAWPHFVTAWSPHQSPVTMPYSVLGTSQITNMILDSHIKQNF